MSRRLQLLLLLVFPVLLFSCARNSGKSSANKKNGKSFTSENYFSEGMKHYMLDEMTEAESWFKKAYEIAPENACVNYMLAKVYFKKNEYDQSLYYSVKSVKYQDKNAYYHELLADIYKQQSNFQEAAKVYKKLIDLYPQQETYYLDLADLYMFQRKYDDVISILNSAEKQFGKSPEISKQVQQLYLSLNNPTAAIEESKSLLAAFPGDESFQLSHAELLVKTQKLEEAKAELNKILAEDPENPYAAYLLASIYKQEGNNALYFEKLKAVFANPEMELETKINLIEEFNLSATDPEARKKMIELGEILTKTHPDNALSHFAAGTILLNNNDKKGAWNEMLKAKALDNTNFNILQQLIILDSDLKQIDSMIAHSNEALEVYPNHAGFWYLSGSAYQLAHKPEDAIAALEQGRKLSGSNNSLLLQFYSLLGDSYNDLKEYSKSDDSYEAALKIDPSNIHVLNNYSYFLSLRKEKLDVALLMAEKMMKQEPDNAAFLDTYAWILYRLDRNEEAKKNLEKALKTSTDGTIIEHYGDVLYKLGEKDKAVAEWIKAKKNGGASELIDKKITDKKLYE